MYFFRSLVFNLVMVSATVIWALVCLLFAPLPYAKRYYMTMRWNVFVIWAARRICGIEYRVLGLENLPDAPVILLSKHQSAWETVFYPAMMPRPLVFVFKRELLWIPFFGWAFALLRMIAIDRSQGKKAFWQVLAQGRQRLANGQWIILFPEGTRTPVGSQGQYKTGGARLAIQTDTLIVPIALNSGERWPRHRFIKRPGLITVSIGPAISPHNRSANELMSAVETWIETEMRRISPHAYESRENLNPIEIPSS